MSQLTVNITTSVARLCTALETEPAALVALFVDAVGKVVTRPGSWEAAAAEEFLLSHGLLRGDWRSRLQDNDRA